MNNSSPISASNPRFSGREPINRPSGPAHEPTDKPSSPASVRSAKPKKSKLKFFTMIALAVLAVIAILFGGWSWYQSAVGVGIDGGKYQAVFLTNGQVYFGKLHTLGGGYMKLTDIYYLQAKTTDTSNDTSSLQSTSNSISDVQLIKLGSEIHGPSDEMIISKDQVLFFENLKKDGKVVESIAKYKNQK